MRGFPKALFTNWLHKIIGDEMNTIDYIQTGALFLLAALAWLLVCIAIWGVPKDSKRQAEELADQADALKTMRHTAEDEWIASLEGSLATLRPQLAKLREERAILPESIRQRAHLAQTIYDAEHALHYLRNRRDTPYPGDRRETMATITEGRM